MSLNERTVNCSSHYVFKEELSVYGWGLAMVDPALLHCSFHVPLQVNELTHYSVASVVAAEFSEEVLFRH